MRVMYKGMQLGKPLSEYHITEVAEIVALYIKNHVNDYREWRGSIRGAINEMWGDEDSAKHISDDSIKIVYQLLRGNKYYTKDSGNGYRVWVVPIDEMRDPTVMVNWKDVKMSTPSVTAPVSTPQKSERPKKKTGRSLPAGLRANIAKRSKRNVKCDFCGKKVVEIYMPIHINSDHPEKTFANRLVAMVEQQPGLTSTEYEKMLGADGHNVSQVMSRLEKQGRISRARDGRIFRLFPAGSIPEQTEIPVPASPPVEAPKPKPHRESDEPMSKELVKLIKTIGVVDNDTLTKNFMELWHAGLNAFSTKDVEKALFKLFLEGKLNVRF